LVSTFELPLSPQFSGSHQRQRFLCHGRFSQAIWNPGFISRDQNIFLLVTLEQPGNAEGYKNSFLSPTRFQWESQNQTKQGDKRGRSIHNHRALGIDVHLFVRAQSKLPGGKGAPFTYAGQLSLCLGGREPITVVWNPSEPILQLCARLRVPPGARRSLNEADFKIG
jgi:hypothetical protein